jgi:hypothetical protein
MHRAIDKNLARPVIETARETTCPVCGHNLHVTQHRQRFVWRLDGLVHAIYRDKRCPNPACEGRVQLYRALTDIRLALPHMSFGLDVVLAVGERHLGQGQSLSRIGRELTAQGVPIHQTHVGALLRDYVTLWKLAQGDEQAVRQRLVQQGGIRLMVDGVQHDDRSPVLVLAWDAISGRVLFGQRLEFRGELDYRPLLERVRAMEVPILSVTTDAEKGLVPAVKAVFPGVPYQLCRTHFLKNCAKPMESDLRQLGESVERRATQVNKLAKRLHQREQGPANKRRGKPAAATESRSPGPGEAAVLAPEVCAKTESVAPPQSAPGEAHPSPPPPQPASLPASEVRPAETSPLGNGVPNLPPSPAVALPDSPVGPPPKVAVPPSGLPPGATAAPTEPLLVRHLCAMVRANARVSGRAPLDPAQLRRHQRLERIRDTVSQLLAEEKKRRGPTAPAPRPGWMPSPRR